ncbi:MAG: hypothetical protein JSS24_16225 [Proteobacteria bacterium]|nr:hypothetical protein [Pseudomonadota bacterium]
MPLDELLSSFIRRRDEYFVANGTIKPRQLMPRPNRQTGRNETSVCRSQYLREEELWELCRLHYDVFQAAPAIGHCVGPARAVYEAGLDIDADGIPYPQHANIVGWPEGEESRNERMNCAQRMSGHFVFKPRRG